MLCALIPYKLEKKKLTFLRLQIKTTDNEQIKRLKESNSQAQEKLKKCLIELSELKEKFAHVQLELTEKSLQIEKLDEER